MNNFRKRVLKNCFEQIRIIQNSENMVEIESAISSATADVFKTRNRGIFVALSSNKEATISKFARREALTDACKQNLKYILAEFVPHRLKSTTMYLNLIKTTI